MVYFQSRRIKYLGRLCTRVISHWNLLEFMNIRPDASRLGAKILSVMAWPATWPNSATHENGKAGGMTDAIKIIGEVEIAKLQLRSGDRLVMKFDRQLTADLADRFRMQLESLLPDGVKAIILGPDIEISVLEAERGFSARFGDA